MTPLHFALALLVTGIWGTNFVVIKYGLSAFPPLLFATLRFAASAFPWIFFIKRPALPWRVLITFGCLLGAGQFGLLFLAMRNDVPPGLASLLMQTQVFFTIIISAVFLKERVVPAQIIALFLAFLGIGLIGWRTLTTTDTTVTTKGFFLIMGAAFSWALSNQVVKRAGRVDMLGFMVWGSLFAAIALLVLSLLTENWATVPAMLLNTHLTAWLAVAWQAIGNTLIGFGIWNWLIGRYPAATVTPMALLVPVFGMSASSVLLHEPLPLWKLVTAALVLAGLALNFLAVRATAQTRP
jgi:O-acetylserine/cysteine efflux transporter